MVGRRPGSAHELLIRRSDWALSGLAVVPTVVAFAPFARIGIDPHHDGVMLKLPTTSDRRTRPNHQAVEVQVLSGGAGRTSTGTRSATSATSGPILGGVASSCG